jgi:signal transduction histidine kinase
MLPGVKFLDDLRAHLERPAPPAPQTDVRNVAAHRKHLLESLDALPRDSGAPRAAAEIHRQLSPHFALHVEALEILLINNVGRLPGDEIARLIDVAMDRHLGLDVTSGSSTLDLEIDRLRAEALERDVWKRAFFQEQRETQWIRQYSREIGLVRLRGTPETTALGKLALELPARDAVRWLLAVECVQAQGASDDWRISRSSAAALITDARWDYDLMDDAQPPPPASWVTLERLAKMGLILLHDTRRGVAQYALLPEGRPLLEEITSNTDTPFMLLARALLQDESAAVLAQYPAAAALVRKESAASLVTRHARMVAHEMRNVVVPMQITLDAFCEDVGARGAADLVERHRGVLDGGIDRIFRFVRDIAQIADLATTPAELFTLVPAVQNAVLTIAAELPCSVSFTQEAELPAVMGYRQRFVMAIGNLLRNAAQARRDPPVKISIVAGVNNGAEVFVRVDDDGPGVPREHRDAVFTPGFSRRAGGSGQGLAYVREVVEEEMAGRINCDESPLGGARFTVRLPVGTRRNV